MYFKDMVFEGVGIGSGMDIMKFSNYSDRGFVRFNGDNVLRIEECD